MKNQNDKNADLAFNCGWALASVQTQGVGLGLKQSFEALQSSGANKVFENVCFYRGSVKDGILGVELLRKNFKTKAFVPKDRLISLEVLAVNLAQMNGRESIKFWQKERIA